MGMLMLLINGGKQVTLSSATSDRLAALGVTAVAVLRSEQRSAVLCEGWALQDGSGAELAAALLGKEVDDVEVLTQHMQLSVMGLVGPDALDNQLL
jgi:hypothetical protein